MHASLPLLDAASWLHAFGPLVLVGIAVVVFIESGVLFRSCPATRCWSPQPFLPPICASRRGR